MTAPLGFELLAVLFLLLWGMAAVHVLRRLVGWLRRRGWRDPPPQEWPRRERHPPDWLP